ncbi:transcription initiation factor TFIID subunit 9 [Drosophila grimshawi]|uniref:GH24066 n=1 Tax=Drosophila grimshawi TaxID=7222 RepID=B4JNX4_DROGR|nr:transcription initiation factor TFIID subunit 9 [Drosophila grimshawi]EDV92417.1 GH24066 [Drosophila grimshawi]
MAKKLKISAEIQPEDLLINDQVIMSMLKEHNIEKDEPHVVNTLLELAKCTCSKCYMTNVLNEAKTIDVDDVRLATNLPPDVNLDMDMDLDNEASTRKGVKRKHQKMEYF